MRVEHHITAAKSLTFLLENRFRIFGFRFGLDPILGLAPWIGDVISALLALYIVWIGARVGVPAKHIDRMMRNILFDLLLGVIPIVGTVGDFLFRSNSRNLDIVLKHHNQAIEGEYVDTRSAVSLQAR
jgi:hypothetical protein